MKCSLTLVWINCRIFYCIRDNRGNKRINGDNKLGQGRVVWGFVWCCKNQLMKIFFASNNEGKQERFKRLLKLAVPDVELLSPSELGVDVLDVEEDGATHGENAEIKARAYFGATDIPILAHDSAFYVEGEGLFGAPKRVALGGVPEKDLTKEEFAEKVSSFWKGIATKYGGSVDAAWVDAFVLIYPDGKIKKSCCSREIVLTNQEFGKPHLQMPMRALYYAKATNKPAILNTEEEEFLEMKPIVDALKDVLNIDI